jgi:hypothetical protein
MTMKLNHHNVKHEHKKMTSGGHNFLRDDNEEYSLMGLVEMVCHICTKTTYSYKVLYLVLITCSTLLRQSLLQCS